jgi:hypothetical protein
MFLVGLKPRCCPLHPAQSRKRKGSQASNLNVKEIRQEDVDNRKDAHLPSSLVVDAYEVVGELLNGVCGNTRLDVLGVVGNEKSLLGLDDDDTLLALIDCQLTDIRK